MSTKMHCYRVRRDQWWEFASSVRQFYLEHGVGPAIARLMASPENVEKWSLTETFSTLEILEKESRDLQVFEESDTYYLFRVLEHGYLFMNKFKEQDWPIEPVFYDNRTDIPPEETSHVGIALWVDEQIEARRYFIWPALTNTDLLVIALGRKDVSATICVEG